MSNELPEHLGGHQGISHIDEGTLDFIINRYDIKTMIDVGCGPGKMVSLAREKKLTAEGIDGDWTVNPDILHDYSKEPYIPEKPVDLAWSVEFLEHVHEEYMPNYMATFQKAKYVFCTASNTTGYHHVNCHPLPYWWDNFNNYGFDYLETESEAIRNSITTMNLNRPYKKQFVKHTGMLYVNRELT